MNLKVENITNECKTQWNENRTETAQVTTTTKTPQDWKLPDTWRVQIEEYLENGLNLIPIIKGTKAPALGSWKEYQTRKATHEEIEKWFFEAEAHSDFHRQFTTFMVHFLRNQLELKWHDLENKQWISSTFEILHQEPWCYREWFKDFPNIPEEFLTMLTSTAFGDFTKEHVGKGHTWGWPKLFDKQNPMLPNLIIQGLRAKENVEFYQEAQKTAGGLLNETKQFWLAGYPDQLRAQANDKATLGDIAFTWLAQNAHKEPQEKLTTSHVAAMLNMNSVQCQRTIMPKLRNIEALLRLFNVEIGHQGEG